MSGYSGPFPYDGLTVLSPKLQEYAVSREDISQYGSGRLGIEIVRNGQPYDPDDIWLDVMLDTDFAQPDVELDWREAEGSPLAFYRKHEITREAPGRYFVDLGQYQTGQKGLVVARWQYLVDATPVEYTTYAQISDPMPMFESLNPKAKEMVKLTQIMLADLFDSTDGGPWLTENFQTHFNAERLAQLATMAMHRINTLGIPVTNYRVEIGRNFPPSVFDSLLARGLYLEAVRHLIRSYTEIPTFPGMQNTYTDRRDYAQRWRSILDEEKPEFEKAIKNVKRSLLGLGGGSLIVAGGIYGGSGSLFRSGMYAAQTRSMRMYPYPMSVIRM